MGRMMGEMMPLPLPLSMEGGGFSPEERPPSSTPGAGIAWSGAWTDGRPGAEPDRAVGIVHADVARPTGGGFAGVASVGAGLFPVADTAAGPCVGASVARRLGVGALAVGSVEGGDAVGEAVGGLDGCDVSDLDGACVGAPVGCNVGFLVGVMVGDLVGRDVGDLVGALVALTWQRRWSPEYFSSPPWP
jgi:hypothetical protein